MRRGEAHLTEDELVATYPRLWHMAQDGSWPSLQAHGLMSAAALVDAYGGDGDTLLRSHRPHCVTLRRDGLPGAVLRDQKPMREAKLVACLQDSLTPAQWYERLNASCFFWLSRQRVWRLLGARAYRGEIQTVLTLDTRGLVAAHRDRIRLSPINSGSTLFVPQPRGETTFRRIADFPFQARAASRAPANNVVELLVEHAVPDLARHVLAVHRVGGGEILSELWRSDSTGPDDRP